MTDFTFYDETDAPEAARPTLERAKQAMGGELPNLYRYMAASPELLEGYQVLRRLLTETTLSPIEQEVVQLAISFENGCRYCMAAHSMRADKLELERSEIEALRAGRALSNAKLEALRRFARKMVIDRGHLADSDIAAFLEAGYSRQTILEVVLAVGAKTLTNYANHLFGTPLNSFMKAYAWEKP